MSSQNFFSAVAEALVERGFQPFGLEVEKNGTAINLHEAVRFALTGSVNTANLPDTSFWEWQEIRPFLGNVWANLDSAVSVVDPNERSAVVWCHPDSRKIEEVLNLLVEASKRPLLARPSATRRPTPRGLVQSAKVAGAIVEGLAVLHENSPLTYGDLIESVVSTLPDLATDLDLLVEIDRLCVRDQVDRSITDNETLVPRALLRAFIKERKAADERGDSLFFLAFLRSESAINNLAGLSDRALLSRLLVLEPERSGSAHDKAARAVVEGS